MNVVPTTLPGVLLIEPKVFGDSRGYFLESYRQNRYQDFGIDLPFVQDNISSSSSRVIRGLHYQLPNSQGKLIQVLGGAIMDVAVDIRRGSPCFGGWVGAVLTSENHHQLFIPPGFAHGFAVLSDHALVSYKCSAYYDPANETTIRWDDPKIGIQWGIVDPIISQKDLEGLALSALSEDRLPRFV